MTPNPPSSFQRPGGGPNNRLRLASFRSQLHTSNAHDTSGVAIDDADADQGDNGLLMAVTDPDATRVYGEVEGDSDGEGDVGEDMDVEAEEWSDAVDEVDETASPQEEDDVFSTPMPSHASLEDDYVSPLPHDMEAGPSRPPSSGRPFDPPHIVVGSVSSPPRMSTASEPLMQRRSIEGLFPPPRMSADAIIEGREEALAATPRSDRQSRRRSFDPRSAIGKLNFMKMNRSTDRLEPPPPPLPPAPASHAPTQTSPSLRGKSNGRSRSPARNMESAPVPPPPPLPAPTLSELGLQLKPVTPLLAAPHMGGVPTSGCLLSPGYLLLCHNDGLDVVPLYAPPAARSYALIRGVPFKSVLVMDMLGFLVCIAGRREGVRVYALSDIKRAIEVRMDVERQKESAKRKSVMLDTALPLKMKKISSRPDGLPSPVRPQSMMGPLGKPPSIAPTTTTARTQPRLVLQTQRSFLSGRPDSPARSLVHQASASSINMVNGRTSQLSNNGKDKEKTEWVENASVDVAPESESDDEGYISVPGPSGERGDTPSPIPLVSTSNGFHGRRRRPADLHLENMDRMGTGMVLISDPMPSPAPSMMNLREALATTPRTSGYNTPVTRTPNPEREVVNFADLLRESRIPDLPPAGTRLPQNATFVRDSATGATTLVSGTRSGTPTTLSPATISPATAPMRWGMNDDASRSAVHLAPPLTGTPRSARRRWSLMGGNGLFSSSPPASPIGPPDSAVSEFNPSLPPSRPPSAPPRPPSTAPIIPTRQSSGLMPRLITNAFKSRSSSEPRQKKSGPTNIQGQSYLTANGKLEHIKLEGTRGAYLIKSVQTNRKSFLAILCGEDGKKVELFTGSSKSASLSLARTFILPDSPLSLELQVQGEDLAELFLIFSDSVFALEPASVRVRQVNIARAERRAARRRRERGRAGSDAAELNSPQQTPSAATFADAAANNGSLQVPSPPPYSAPSSIPRTRVVSSTVTAGDPDARRRRPRRNGVPEGPSNGAESRGPNQKSSATTAAYTTFQQLSFSPTFPLGTLAEDWIIPPTYPSFVKHKSWLQATLGGEAGDQDRDVTQPPAEHMYNLWHGIMNSWPRRGSLREGLLNELQESSKVTLEDYFLPPISLLAQPAHYGPPCLFFCSRGGLSTAIVDHKGKSVLLDKFHWSASSSTSTKGKYARRPAGLGDIQRVEAFDGNNNGAVLVAVRESGLEAVDIADALLAPSTTTGAVSPAQGSYSRRLNWSWDVADPYPINIDPSVSPNGTGGDHRALAAAKLNGVANLPTRSASVPLGHDYHNNQYISYLGREGSRVYMCTRSANMFRVICLQSSIA
ncbi:hypothetical protein CALVIDRAFT_554025 [Calocera viscosa TUFC12733]|uniref:CNH domain-containing protein n=1 Tax=Calocera viscosa (strain TUFC12733) TaxID=1330018 RepID=A0A167P4C0_CALVF|nr:hypothetical protein CALVIDRAFT_554025 [Calocera viscosa TUFC12733]